MWQVHGIRICARKLRKDYLTASYEPHNDSHTVYYPTPSSAQQAPKAI